MLLLVFDYVVFNGFFVLMDDSIGWNVVLLLMDEVGVK